MSDEELDGLFKKSVESFEPPFDPEAWKAMEQKLDQAQVHAPRYKRNLPLLLLSLILTLLMVTQLKDENFTPADEEVAAVAQKTPQATANTPLGQPAHKAEAAAMAGAKKARPATPAEMFESATPRKPGKAEATAKPGAYKAAAVVRPSDKEAPQPALAAPAREVDDAVPSETVEIKMIDNGQPEQPMAAQQPEEAADSAALEHAAPEAVAADSNRKKKTSPFARSIRLAVIAAPDFTTVKFRNPEAISANVGVVVGVPLTNRLSLVTGMVWANKVYGAAPEDYNPGPDYWQGKKIPDAIDARCRVLDILLNLEYRLLQRNKSTLAVQAGLSSYIMLDEKYTYIYGTGYGTYEKTWEVQNQNRHWFKVQNISLSYTHHLTPSFFVGAEPYIKIPLSGVGAGNVKLTSAGIFISAGYNLSLKK